jgi:hypothetical protein
MDEKSVVFLRQSCAVDGNGFSNLSFGSLLCCSFQLSRASRRSETGDGSFALQTPKG